MTNGATVTPVLPTHATDDILLCFAASTTSTDTLTCSTSGWSEVADSPQDDTAGSPSGSVKLAVFWKRAAGAAETNPAVAGATNTIMAVGISYAGCRTSDPPWDVTSGGDTGGSATATPAIPGDTTTVADCLVTAVVATSTDLDNTDGFASWANADLGSITEQFDSIKNLGLGVGLGIMTGTKAVAGSYGNTTVTLDNSSILAFMTIALTATSAGTADIELAWNDLSTIEDGFKIERDTDGGGYAQIDTVAADVETYTDSGVATGHTYTYRVRSYNANGNSSYSNTDSVVVP